MIRAGLAEMKGRGAVRLGAGPSWGEVGCGPPAVRNCPRAGWFSGQVPPTQKGTAALATSCLWHTPPGTLDPAPLAISGECGGFCPHPAGSRGGGQRCPSWLLPQVTGQGWG